jgi:eukaryotic-like serine/threonine-protein kinase
MNNKLFAIILGYFFILGGVAAAPAKPGNLNEMVLIPAGNFQMGSPDEAGDQDEHPQHQVYLDVFYIDKYLVTFGQYDKFCEATGRAKPDDDGWGRGMRPVINVTWDDANSYARWAGKRLPTEAEYEKATRGGTITTYFFGDDESQLGDYAWYHENSSGMTHPVGEKKPNPFGLYDILGNTWEWCSDFYEDNYYTVSPAKNPTGPDMGTLICLRGGSWNSFAYSSRSANRNGNLPQYNNIYGFRCAKNH